MSTITPIQITVTFTDDDLDAEELDAEARNLLHQMYELEEVKAQLLEDTKPPAGSKSAGSAIVGVLTAEVSLSNARKAIDFLHDRLYRKPIELEVEREYLGDKKRLKLKVNDSSELGAVIEQAKKFLEL